MPISISDSIPGTAVDEATGDLVISPSPGGALELQDDTGTTQISVTQSTTNISNTLQQQGVNVATSDSLDGKADKSGTTFTGDVVIEQTTPASLTLKAEDNTLDTTGIGWQNTGLSYSAAIHREFISNFNTDIIFRTGTINNDPLLIDEVLRIRTNVGTAATQGDVIVSNDLHATGVVATTLTQNGNNVLDSTATTADVGASTDRNYVTDAESTSIDNLPADTNAELALKADISGEIFTGTVQATTVGVTASNAAQLLALGNGGNLTGDSGIAWRVGAVNNARTGNYRARINHHYDNDSLEISVGNNSNQNNLPIVVQLLTDAINLNQNVAITGNISSSDATNINAVGGLIADAATVKSYVDSQASFNGGTITTPLVVESGVDDKKLITLKRTDNTRTLGLAWQNSGSNYIKSIFVDEADGENLKIASGSDADIDNLSTIIEIFPDGTLHAQGDIFAFNGGNMAALDITATGTLQGLNGTITNDLTVGGNETLTGNLTVNGNITTGQTGQNLDFRNTGAATDLQRFRFSAETSGRFNLDALNDNGTVRQTWSFLSQFGNTILPGTLSLSNGGDLDLPEDSKLSMRDEQNTLYLFEKSLAATTATGLALRTTTNPSDGEPLFQVQSSGNSPRLRVEHLGHLSTSNEDMKVGIANDGTAGNYVFHEGNKGLATRAEIYLDTTGTDNPIASLTTQTLIDAKGSHIILVGVGALSATLPTISDFGTSNGNFDYGEVFTVINMNSGSSITINTPSGYQQAIGTLDSTTTGAVSITSGSRVTFVACDGTSFSSWAKKTWLAFDPNF